MVLDFKKRTHYWRSNLWKQNVLGDVQFWARPELCWLHRWPWRRVSRRLSALPVWAGTCQEHLVACWSIGTSFLCARDKPRVRPQSDSFQGIWALLNCVGQVVDLEMLIFKPCLTNLFLWILKKVWWTYRSATSQSFQSWSGFILDNRCHLYYLKALL